MRRLVECLPRASALWVAIGTVAASGFSFLFQGSLSLLLTDATFGAISSAIVIAVGLSFFSTFGVQNVTLNLVKSQGVSSRSVLLRFIHVWIMTYMLLSVGGIALLLTDAGDFSRYIFISSLTLILSLFAILAADQQSADNFRGVCLYLIAPELAKVFAVCIVALVGVRQLSGVYLAFGVVFLALATLPLLVSSFWSDWHAPSFYGALFVTGFPYAVTGLLFMIYYRATLVVLDAYGMLDAAGSLAIVYLLITAVLLIPTSWSQRYLLGVWHAIPRADVDGFRAELWRQLRAMLLFSGPIAVAWLFLSRSLLGLVYGDRYALAQVYVPWFAAVFLLRAICIPLHSATSVEGMKWPKTWVVFAAAATTLAFSLALVRPMGLGGALVAGIAAELVLAVGMVALVRIHLRGGVPWHAGSATAPPNSEPRD